MIFVDTWAWLALAYRKDPYHPFAVHQHRQFQKEKQVYVTTDYVLSESITALFRVIEFATARLFVQRLLYSLRIGQDQLVFISPDQFEKAWAMRQKYKDRPDVSFVDFSSMVVMQELGVPDVFTGDEHFRQVNLGFRLFP